MALEICHNTKGGGGRRTRRRGKREREGEEWRGEKRRG